jgi:hypothetical protein
MKIKSFNINKLKKVKPGHLRITTVDNRFYNDAPYINSKTSLPGWFRRIHKGPGSIRSCSGISDFLEFGVTIQAWTTFRFRPNINTGVWEISADEFNPSIEYPMATGFHFAQTGSCPMTESRKIEKMSYPKLLTPWRIQTAPGWSCLFIPTFYEENENYSVLPSIVNTDFYQVANVVLNVKTDSEFVIKQGTPLVHLIPVQRKNDIRKIEYVDESFFKYASTNMYMTGGTVPSNGGSGVAYRKATRLVDASVDKKRKWFRRG